MRQNQIADSDESNLTDSLSSILSLAHVYCLPEVSRNVLAF